MIVLGADTHKRSHTIAAVSAAALREGLDALPAAQLEGPELDLRLLVDHRERLVRQRVALNNTLQWHLHDIWPELRLPGSSCPSPASGRSPPPSSSARSPARTGSQATPSSPAPPASLRSPSAQARPTATASTAAATARSTPPSTASPSPACAATQRPRTTSHANAPKAKPPKKPSAASNATSPAASGTCSKPAAPPPTRPSHHQSLDIGAAQAAVPDRGIAGATKARGTAGRWLRCLPLRRA